MKEINKDYGFMDKRHLNKSLDILYYLEDYFMYDKITISEAINILQEKL